MKGNQSRLSVGKDLMNAWDGTMDVEKHLENEAVKWRVNEHLLVSGDIGNDDKVKR